MNFMNKNTFAVLQIKKLKCENQNCKVSKTERNLCVCGQLVGSLLHPEPCYFWISP